MPDLTTEPTWTCKTNLFWTTKVQGIGGKYDVTWQNPQIPELRKFTVRGWHCSCKAFQYGMGRYCKHVKAVIEVNERCGWNEELEPTLMPARAADAEGRPECPKCGGEVESIEVGV